MIFLRICACIFTFQVIVSADEIEMIQELNAIDHNYFTGFDFPSSNSISTSEKAPSLIGGGKAVKRAWNLKKEKPTSTPTNYHQIVLSRKTSMGKRVFIGENRTFPKNRPVRFIETGEEVSLSLGAYHSIQLIFFLLRDGKFIFPTHNQSFPNCAISDDEKKVAYSDLFGQVSLWTFDGKTLSFETMLYCNPFTRFGSFSELKFSPDGSALIGYGKDYRSNSRDVISAVWDTSDRTYLYLFVPRLLSSFQTESFQSRAILLNGSWVFFPEGFDADGQDVERKSLLRNFRTHEMNTLNAGVRSHVISEDRKKIIGVVKQPVTEELTLRTWSIPDGKEVSKLLELQIEPQHLALHPNGEFLAICDESESIQVLNLNKPSEVIKLTQPLNKKIDNSGEVVASWQAKIFSAHFSDDGTRLAAFCALTGSQSDTIRIWNTESLGQD